jgi:hypothetical protein
VGNRADEEALIFHNDKSKNKLKNSSDSLVVAGNVYTYCI